MTSVIVVDAKKHEGWSFRTAKRRRSEAKVAEIMSEDQGLRRHPERDAAEAEASLCEPKTAQLMELISSDRHFLLPPRGGSASR